MGSIQLMSRGRRHTTHTPTHTNLTVSVSSTILHQIAAPVIWPTCLTKTIKTTVRQGSACVMVTLWYVRHPCHTLYSHVWVLVTNCWSQTWRLPTLSASFFCTDSLFSPSRWSVLIISLSKWTANFPLLSPSSHPPSKSSWQPPFLSISPPFLLFILYCIPLAKSKVYSVIFQRETNMQTPCPFFLAGGIHK